MARDRIGGGPAGRQRDERIATIERLTIPFEAFRTALRRNYLDEAIDAECRIRISGPFEAEVEAEYYETDGERSEASDSNPMPLYIHPEQLVFQGLDGGFRDVREWPTRSAIEEELSDAAIEDAGGPEAALEAAREEFWDELREKLPAIVDLGTLHGFMPEPVAVEWTD